MHFNDNMEFTQKISQKCQKNLKRWACSQPIYVSIKIEIKNKLKIESQ